MSPILLDDGGVSRLLTVSYSAKTVFKISKVTGILPCFVAIYENYDDVSVILQQGVDAVVLLAAIVGEKACDNDPRTTVDSNYIGAKLIAEACKYYGVPRFIFASTDSAYGIQEGEMFEDSPVNPISLCAIEDGNRRRTTWWLRSSAFFPTVLRMATLYGYSPKDALDLVINILSAHAWANGRIKVFGGNSGGLYTVEDAARAYVLVLNSEVKDVAGEVFNVGLNAQNHQIELLGEIVSIVFPNLDIETIPQTPDLRDYRVNFDKINRVLGYEVFWSIHDGIAYIRDALDQGLVEDFEDGKYYNA